MNRSTIAMMCSYSGYLEDVPPYAVVDVDWSNALEAWSAATPMDTEERLLVQAGMLKLGGGGGGGGGGASAAPPPLVMIYRNTVYGYPWMTSVRFILDDDAYRPWFLHAEHDDRHGPLARGPRAPHRRLPRQHGRAGEPHAGGAALRVDHVLERRDA